MQMYKFTTLDGTANILNDSTAKKFMQLLKSRWDELHDKSDVFRYKIDNFQERIVDSKYLLQLNPDRGSKRRLPEQINSVCQPFDKNKFNFTKVSTKEILFDLVKEGSDCDVHSLVVNVSPISRYHTLLCPSLSKCLPQVITQDSFEVALDVMFLAEYRDLRIGFNSLCALASVNHLHFHLFLESNTLPVETAKCRHLKGPLFCFEDYPAPAFCFQIKSSLTVKDSAKQIYQLLSYFIRNSIAHNLFITRGNGIVAGDEKIEVVRVIVWPRKSSSGVKQLDAFNVAVCEFSGWFPVFDKTSYENLKTETLERELTKWKINNFDMLCEEVKSIYNL